MTQLEELVRQSEVKAVHGLRPIPRPATITTTFRSMRRAAKSIRKASMASSAASSGSCSRSRWESTTCCRSRGWDRGPGAPSQAVLIDFPARRFYFFFIELWPQEIYYLTGLLILAAIGLFLMNALAGRIWCGYLCPQTVWTDLFFAIERLTEGDRREHMRRDAQPWTLEKYARKGTKHFLWLMIAWWTGGAWVLYFADAPTLVKDLATGNAPFTAYLWIGILTATTYTLAGHMREQVCLYMCPWPRIQAALTDEYALNVHLSLRSRRAALLCQEVGTIARRRRAGRRLHRLPAMRPTFARPASIFAAAPTSAASSADSASMPATG